MKRRSVREMASRTQPGELLMEGLLTEQELADRLRLSRSSAWKLRGQGLPFMRVGGSIRYLWSEVALWLKQRAEAEKNRKESSNEQ